MTGVGFLRVARRHGGPTFRQHGVPDAVAAHDDGVGDVLQRGEGRRREGQTNGLAGLPWITQNRHLLPP